MTIQYGRCHTQITISFGLSLARQNAHAFYHVSLGGDRPPPEPLNVHMVERLRISRVPGGDPLSPDLQPRIFTISLESAVADLRRAHLDMYVFV